jgi:dUTP pyrophosphatase
MVLMPIHKINMEEVDSLPDSIRGKGGFGSTGQ